MADGQLLERFLARRDEAAFAALVRRHGPMVFGVCRRVLRDRGDAEDAFQATFLVLVRKAASVGRRELLGSWLYGVAHRTALKARALAVRRRGREQPLVDVAMEQPVADLVWRELRPILDEELSRLPEKYRAAVVLCWLEGQTKREAAGRLGWPEGTVSARLARARQLLQRRLARRGLTLSAGVLMAAISQGTASAAVPHALFSSTVRSATLLAAGGAAAGGIPAPVAGLTQGVLRAMLVSKLQVLTAILLMLVAVGIGVAHVGSQASGPAQVSPAKAETGPKFPAPQQAEGKKPEGGVVVLDNCDPEYQGKTAYEDNLSFVSAAGKLRGRISTLNVCEEIGSPHRLVVDVQRGRLWLAETVGRRLLQYDLNGNQVHSVDGVQASALAIDPATGHAWVATGPGSIGKGKIEVFDQAGKRVAEHHEDAYDIAYDARGKAFWLAGRQLVKLSPDGKVLTRRTISTWCASSVVVNQKTGVVWVAVRQHSQVGDSVNELLAFDGEGKRLHKIPLGDKVPFRVAVDAETGAVWVANLRQSLLRFSAEGKQEVELLFSALTVEVEAGTGNAWVVTPTEILKINPRGDVLARVQLRGKTTQAWIAGY
jgi:RNA polymerase sigma factor (sigma-70 family)